jgi:asparagine synthase (glutamine-hydrolysing)
VDSHLTFPTGTGLVDDLADLIYSQEEPFGSTSVYAQWKVFELMKQGGVKVALDGQGADELLAGYASYVPALLGELLVTFQWQAFAKECLAQPRSKTLRQDLLLAISYAVPEAVKRPLRLLRELLRSHEDARGVIRFPSRISNVSIEVKDVFLGELYKSLVYAYLPSYLRYEDKNSMAHSIESRLPFLDYRLVEFAFSLPWQAKICQGTTKQVLRAAMKGILPESVRDRRDKVGFSTPEDVWLKAEMKGEIGEVLNPQSLGMRPYFTHEALHILVEAYHSGRPTDMQAIWRLLNLELWMRMFIDRSDRPGSPSADGNGLLKRSCSFA